MGTLAINIGEDIELSRAAPELEARLGARVNLPKNWFLEPYVRGGYPFLWGAGILAGIRFPVNRRTGLLLGISAHPNPFSPDGDGEADVTAIVLEVKSGAPIVSWEVEIRGPAGAPGGTEPLFRRFTGAGSPPAYIDWDGTGDSGEPVMSAVDYPITFRAKDIYGNSAVASGSASIKDVSVDVLQTKEGDKLRLHASSIGFNGYEVDLTGLSREEAAMNQKVLDRVAELLNTKYARFSNIRVEGHANPMTGRPDEEQRLQPISEKRAAFIVEELVKRGVNRRRLSAVGMGGAFPIVDISDTENRWKNRRVEFLLSM